MSLKYTRTLSHKGGKVSLWKQGGEISKSYLLRRELRQQKGVHGVSGSKAENTQSFSPHSATVDVVIKPPLSALYFPTLCLYLTMYLCANICCVCAEGLRL